MGTRRRGIELLAEGFEGVHDEGVAEAADVREVSGDFRVGGVVVEGWGGRQVAMVLALVVAVNDAVGEEAEGLEDVGEAVEGPAGFVLAGVGPVFAVVGEASGFDGFVGAQVGVGNDGAEEAAGGEEAEAFLEEGGGFVEAEVFEEVFGEDEGEGGVGEGELVAFAVIEGEAGGVEAEFGFDAGEVERGMAAEAVVKGAEAIF